MEIYSYLFAFILFHGMILSQTSCMVNVSLRHRRPLPPPPPPENNQIIHPKPKPPFMPLPPFIPIPKSPPPPRTPPLPKVNDGHHPSLPPPPPHTYGSPRYPPPPQRCVEVVGCVKCEELASWEAVPEGVRLEGQTDFCWLCEQPQKLLVPFEMRGYQGVYNLERKIHEAAIRGLVPVKGPMPVKFPLPNPQDPFSLKPGSISVGFSDNKASVVEKSEGLSAAIAGARAAATQFNKKDQNLVSNTTTNSYSNSTSSGRPDSKSLEEDKMLESCSAGGSGEEASVPSKTEQLNPIKCEESSSRGQTREDLKQIPGASAKVLLPKNSLRKSSKSQLLNVLTRENLRLRSTAATIAMEIYSYLLAFIIFHGMILSQTSCMVNVSLQRRRRLPPPPPPENNKIVHPKPKPPTVKPYFPKSPPPRTPPPPKVNDGYHPSLPPPPPHTYGSPRYPPPPQPTPAPSPLYASTTAA
ncbi:hypothetical protein NC653_040878 [Populus alba x Populus x berolinensis]|uniref:Uncharacterized protein n=1 Tax=Populus alba x Populus x berolinensis TaxID=444605 RepID=A0AAD6PNA6_9ROSI|nr:hypothetical protein NC653_040878 [Populus alba x Populus x berolinensis]